MKNRLQQHIRILSQSIKICSAEVEQKKRKIQELENELNEKQREFENRTNCPELQQQNNQWKQFVETIVSKHNENKDEIKLFLYNYESFPLKETSIETNIDEERLKIIIRTFIHKDNMKWFEEEEKQSFLDFITKIKNMKTLLDICNYIK